MGHTSGIAADVFDKGNWYHEVLEDGLAISYRVRPAPPSPFPTNSPARPSSPSRPPSISAAAG